ncbi:biotin/lipoyl-containing protein [Pelagicoccus mobilis]|uniref:Lipoyl-binding domain-containing protein n=1 Tax=Pelagicoccus mobilis TaxID=415221 RepID=A0A934RSX0_9BACT|nr:biotin/lipoyl-containing protein [Pelagicoccus mobilis]MBK1876985.1 hypothetical protein [Pelagicoccus mobilis]
MKYKVRQADAKRSINIEGKYDFMEESPIQIDKATRMVRILETDTDGAVKTVMIDNRLYHVRVRRRGDGFPEEVVVKGVPYPVNIDKIESTRYRPPPAPKKIAGDVVASMPGQVIALMLKEGDKVEKGQSVLILEAMKMENEILAPKSGVLKKVASKEGDLVMKGDLLFEVD